MKPNYHPWGVKVGDFFDQKSEVDKLRFLLRFATLAPSGHNTQPWIFSIDRNEISLWVNTERSLEGSDPQRHQLLIAFGCMIENLVIAAQYYGFGIKINYFPDPQSRDFVARVVIGARQANSEGDLKLIAAIPLRHTNRGKYSDQPLPESFLKELERVNNEDLKISIVTDPTKKDAVADIINEAQIEAMDDSVFREELSHFIKSSFTNEHAGMPGFALEIPALVSLFASSLVKRVNLSRKTKKKDDMLLKRHTPAFIVISSRKNDPAHWLAAGRLFERLWLMATAEGLNCSPLAAAIQSPRHNAQLQQVLGVDCAPQVFFRIGYAKKRFGHSPRFTVPQLIKSS